MRSEQWLGSLLCLTSVTEEAYKNLCLLSPAVVLLKTRTNEARKPRGVTHTHPFNGPFSGTTRVGRYQKGKTNLDFTEARDSEWQ